jgi:hypothetical protein
MATITQDIPNIEDIEAAAAKLTPGQREVLIDRIREMNEEIVDPEVEAAWDTEIRRRIDEIDNGEAELLDFDEVMGEMREKYGLS